MRVMTPTSSLPPEVRRFHAAVMRRVMADLATLTLRHDLTPAQISALFHLRERGVLRASDLGSALGLTSGTVTHLLARLAARGLVERVAPGEDGRERPTRLSAGGEAFLAEFDRGLAGALLALVAPVPPEVLAELASAMGRVLAATGEG